MGEPILERHAGNESLRTRVVTEVAERENIDPTELSPLIYTAIDTDALEELFFGKTDGFTRVEFTYAGHHITIQGEDAVQIKVD